MSVDEIHEKDVGTVFEVTMKDGAVIVDLSAQTAMTFYFKKSDGTVITGAGAYVTDGTDGKAKYTVPDNTILTPAGNWEMQFEFTDPAGTWRSNRHAFRVFENL